MNVSPTFKTGTSYALRDPTTYDDEMGAGYNRAETYGKIECEGMYIVDCWITNEAGEIHPGYAEEPVPVQFCDLIPESARPSTNSDVERSGLPWA